jgi:hypothetical protein
MVTSKNKPVWTNKRENASKAIMFYFLVVIIHGSQALYINRNQWTEENANLSNCTCIPKHTDLKIFMHNEFLTPQ